MIGTTSWLPDPVRAGEPQILRRAITAVCLVGTAIADDDTGSMYPLAKNASIGWYCIHFLTCLPKTIMSTLCRTLDVHLAELPALGIVPSNVFTYVILKENIYFVHEHDHYNDIVATPRFIAVRWEGFSLPVHVLDDLQLCSAACSAGTIT